MNHHSSITIITSGAFVNQELIAEFGLLPPSFLPVGMGRLYDIQVDSLQKNNLEKSPLYLTVPKSFYVPEYDKQRLKKKNVTIISVPDNLSIGESIVYTINLINGYNKGVRILHGDTVINDIPLQFDIIAASEENDDYSWATLNHFNGKILNIRTIEATKEQETKIPIACGYFAFSSAERLVRSIVQARGKFINGLNKYIKHYDVEMKMIKNWYDFGHIQTYFHSRRLITTERAFNSLKITQNTVYKFSSDTHKMKSEAKWFKKIPPDIQPYTARLFDEGNKNNQYFYSTEYQYTPTLSELYVFSTIGRSSWKKILISCKNFLEVCNLNHGKKLRDVYTQQLLENKIIERLEKFEKETNFGIEHDLTYNGKSMPSLLNIALTLKKMISYDASVMSTVMHGDFCFSNILYNSRNSRISVIDPRGYVFNKKQEIYGDLRYDIAKFSHSINGLYDFIIAGHYELLHDRPYDFNIVFTPSMHREWLQKKFSEMTIVGLKTSNLEICAITILLFISMLPLHADRPDRQKAFIANALRLYSDLERKK